MSENIPVAHEIKNNQYNSSNPTMAQMPQMSQYSQSNENIQGPRQIMININSEVENTLTLCWKYSKTVKILSFIDLFFCLLYAISASPVLLLISVMPLCGYVGAIKYKKNYLFVYLFFTIIITICRFLSFGYVDNDNKNTVLAAIFSFFGILVSIWICLIIRKFIRLIDELDENQLNHLREGWIPINTQFIYY